MAWRRSKSGPNGPFSVVLSSVSVFLRSPEYDGPAVGVELGPNVGVHVVGSNDGVRVGKSERVCVGEPDGACVGRPDGINVGKSDGASEGTSDGATVGCSVGRVVGRSVGGADGDADGLEVYNSQSELLTLKQVIMFVNSNVHPGNAHSGWQAPMELDT